MMKGDNRCIPPSYFCRFLGSVIAGFLSLSNRDRMAEVDDCRLLLLSLLFSIIAFAEVAIGGKWSRLICARWIVSGDFAAHWRLRFDTLTAVMLIVVTGVSSMVHIYSVGYMSHDNARAAFHVISQPVYLCHADAGNGRQSGPAVFRLGRGGRCLLSADWLLVQKGQRPYRRDEGLCGQPGW